MNNLDRNSIKDMLVSSKEVLEILGIKRARLSQLVKTGKIQPVKKNIYLLIDVLERKRVQEELREKFYRPKHYNLNLEGD